MTTMLDKCAVAGDITQAIDRTGCWAAAITVIGGISSTAVKLQTCDTVDGVFEDFKELVAAASAETDQYKGFVIDLHGAKKYIKVTGAVMATAVFGDCEADVKSLAITEGEVPSGADLDNNVAETINASTYTEPVEILPTEGKDGMKKATITLENIPSGGSDIAYAWVTNGVVNVTGFSFSVAPSTFALFKQEKIVSRANNQYTVSSCDNEYFIGYEKISDNEFTVTYAAGSDTLNFTYTRDNTKDFSLWQTETE